MSLILKLQELDNLVIKKTTSPVTAILREKIHSALEQAESDAALIVENAQLKAELLAMKAPKVTSVKIIRT